MSGTMCTSFTVVLTTFHRIFKAIRYDDVPKGTGRFAFITRNVSSARLYAPSGLLAGDVDQTMEWTALQPELPEPGLWRIDVRKLERTCWIDLTGVPGLLWLSKEKTVSF